MSLSRAAALIAAAALAACSSPSAPSGAPSETSPPATGATTIAPAPIAAAPRGPTTTIVRVRRYPTTTGWWEAPGASLPSIPGLPKDLCLRGLMDRTPEQIRAVQELVGAQVDGIEGPETRGKFIDWAEDSCPRGAPPSTTATTTTVASPSLTDERKGRILTSAIVALIALDEGRMSVAGFRDVLDDGLTAFRGSPVRPMLVRMNSAASRLGTGAGRLEMMCAANQAVFYFNIHHTEATLEDYSDMLDTPFLRLDNSFLCDGAFGWYD